MEARVPGAAQRQRALTATRRVGVTVRCAHQAPVAAQPEEATAPKAAKSKRAAGGEAPAGKHRKKEPPPPPAAGSEDEGEEGTQTPEYGGASSAELTAAIREIVRQADLTVLTPRAVREELEIRLELQAGSLRERKQEVSRLIDAVLASLRSSESSAPAD